MARPNPLEGAQEIQEMLVSYAKQETLAPLKQLGRYLGFGLAGSLFVFLGVFFAGLATLRLLQTFEVFGGASWASLAPYGASVGVLIIALILIFMSLNRARRKVLS
ncbi:MAG: hypothetical protein AAF531_07030 [Actinomycetota bacterium]